MAKHIKIVLADDHFAIRAGTRTLLDKESDFFVVGEADDGIEAYDLVERHKPDLLICDLSMPHLTGREVVRRVAHKYPQVKIVILSMHTEDQIVAEAIQNGASAYILKNASGEEMIEGIRAALQGEIFLGQPFAQKGLDTYLEWDLSSDHTELNALTNREREVLQLVAEGKTSSEIALILSIASRTVETHRANLMKKLQLKSMPDLIRYAIRHGLLPLE
ncbi:MAG: response regulator transcription factor [Ardenticatenaceae bacterium]|nr:response regulator transcription factor [Ardenticatenaceae bacterium]